MQRYTQELITSVGHPEDGHTAQATVEPVMVPRPAGEWVRFADVPLATITALNIAERDCEAAVGKATNAERERDAARQSFADTENARLALLAELRIVQVGRDTAQREVVREHDGRVAAARERDAALKLAEERSLAAGIAEEALRKDAAVIQALNAQCEADRARAGAAEKALETARADRDVLTRMLAETRADAILLAAFPRLREVIAGPSAAPVERPGGGWSYDMEAAPRDGSSRDTIELATEEGVLVGFWHLSREWLAPRSLAPLPTPYAWRRVRIPPRPAATEGS